uniref:Molybdate-anion transporter n=1 Tax=Zooxanthella nutricula TaxID=1333877 RepID=A0A7S2PPE9_9DINO
MAPRGAALSLAAAAAVQLASAVDVNPSTAVELSWFGFLTQSFYHMSVLPLLATTVVLAYLARPSTSDDFPAGFKTFAGSYLMVWSLCVAADWLQGPYVYALYAAYGFSGKEIAELFVAGFGSSLVFGCFVGTFTDKFGRKKCCLLYCVLYILSCLTKHFKWYSMLMVGRVTGGIATSMLFSCFECWMVSEHTQRHLFSGGLLGFMFGMMFTVMYCVAIASGLAGQAAADSWKFAPLSEGSVIWVGGYCCPFDLAIICLIIGMVLIAFLFEENYGSTESAGGEEMSQLDNLKQAGALLFSDKRMLLLGIVVSTFEGSMFAFVFNWTPALKSSTNPPPHGVIFAMFMMACMCGASAATLFSAIAKPSIRLVVCCATGFMSFVLASVAALDSEGHLRLSLSAFLLFEFCVGVYFPSVGVLKSDVVPEQVRGTMYNLYRVPLNAIVVGLLLSNIPMATCFKLNALLLLAALVSVVGIMTASGNVLAPPKVKSVSKIPASYGPVSTNDQDAREEKQHAKDTVIGRRRNTEGISTPPV